MTTYAANNSPYVTPSTDFQGMYADACRWENNPGSPNYRSCIGGDYKTGGSLVVTSYTVKILSTAPTGTSSLSSLLYDFSGSSYHYNADYSVGARVLNVIGPTSVTIVKSFSPKAIAPGGNSTMTITLSNPTTEVITGAGFTDPFPTNMTYQSTTSNACGGTLTDSGGTPLGAGDVGIKLANGSIPASGSCSVVVVVSASAGSYANQTGHLFIYTTTDTGNFASDTLTAATVASCTANQTAVNWTVPSTSLNPPDLTGGAPTTWVSAKVATAVAAFNQPGGTGGSQIISTDGQNDTYSWDTWGYKNAGNDIRFTVDTSKFSSAVGSMYLRKTSNGPTSIFLEYSTNGGTSWTGTTSYAPTTTYVKYSINLPSQNSVIFRVRGTGANTDSGGADLFADNIAVVGCAEPVPGPGITKTFRNAGNTADVTSIIQGATSTLRFTLTNTATGNVALTGVAFTDTLPLGLDVTSGTSSTCGGTLTRTDNTSPTRDVISFSGGTLAAGGTCTIDVPVVGTTSGAYNNTSGFVSSIESGATTNYAEDSLTVIAPPTLLKSFSPSAIYTSGTTTLTFTIKNPNASALSGINFTDTLPSGLTAPNGTTNSVCTAGSLVITGGNLLTFSGGSLTAGSSCSFSVTVTGAAAGSKTNTTGNISSTESGPGTFATAPISVVNQMSLIGLTKLISTDGANFYKFVGFIPAGNVWYRFIVSNDGETTLNGIALSDPSISVCTLPDSSLAPGTTTSCTVGPIAVSSAPGTNPYPNTATVTTTTYTPTTPVTSSALYGTESLAIVKTASETYFTAAGNTLHYRYSVSNNGGFPLFGPVTVTDDKITGAVTCQDLLTIGDFDDYLDPGESVTCPASGYATYTVLAADVTAGSVTNSATATAGGVTSSADSETVNLAAMTIDKDTSTALLIPGDTATYTIQAVNTGTTTLNHVVFSDTLPGTAQPWAWLVTNITTSANLATQTSNTCQTFNVNSFSCGDWDIQAGGSVTLTVSVKVSASTPAATYNNTASVSSTQTGSIDDDGTAAQDSNTPAGSDPATDEDVQIISAALDWKPGLVRYRPGWLAGCRRIGHL